EFEADKFAVENANGRSLITALVKLFSDNASTLTPDPVYSAFYSSHPDASTRINAIEKILRNEQQ
ncbi:M48 family metalloprotease, partial [Turicimonas muris]